MTLKTAILVCVMLLIGAFAAMAVSATPLNAICGDTIVASGQYELNQTLNCSGITEPGQALMIATDNVVLDCNGFVITNTDKTGEGIMILSQNNITIKNCDISGFHDGVLALMATNSLFENLTLHDNNGGLMMSGGNGNKISTVTTNDNDDVGITLNQGTSNNVVNDVTSMDNGHQGIYVLDSANVVINGANIHDNTLQGIYLSDSDAVTFDGTSATTNGADGFFIVNSNVTLQGCTSNGNQVGLTASGVGNLTMNGTTVSGNLGAAMNVTDVSLLFTGNTITTNALGIFLSNMAAQASGSSFTGNIVTGNGGTQLEVLNTQLSELSSDITTDNNFGTETAAVKQLFDAFFRVVDISNSSVENATVNVYDNGDSLPTYTLKTDASGNTTEVVVTSVFLDSNGVDHAVQLLATGAKVGVGLASTQQKVNDTPSNYGPVLIKFGYCGRAITSDTTLTDDVDCNGQAMDPPALVTAALTIGANDVTLDCDGHNILNGNMTGSGIFGSSVTNVTLKNCNISGFKTGIQFLLSTGVTLENNVLHDNYQGATLSHVLNGLVTSDNIVRDNTNDGIDIGMGSDNTQVNGEFRDNGHQGIYVSDSANVVINGANIHDNTLQGIYLSDSPDAQILDSTINNNDGGLYSRNNVGNSFTVKNTSFSNNEIGLTCFQNTMSLTDNTFSDEKTGIYADECVGVDNASLSGNTFSDNTNATVMHNADVDDFMVDYLGGNAFSGNTWTLIQEWSVNLQVNYQNTTGANNASYSVRTTDGTVESFGVTDAFGAASLLVTEIKSAQGKTPLVFTTPTYFHAEKDVNGSTLANTTGVTIDAQKSVTLVLGNFSDQDYDGVADASDNCPSTFNPDQSSTHGVSQGDACYTAPPPNGGGGGRGGGAGNAYGWISPQPTTETTPPTPAPTPAPAVEPAPVTAETPTPAATAPVAPAPETAPEENGITGAVTGGGFGGWTWFFILLGLIVIVFIAIMIVRARKK